MKTKITKIITEFEDDKSNNQFPPIGEAERLPLGAMFIGLSTSRNGTINRRWTRALIFITLNSAGFTFVAGKMDNDGLSEAIIATLLLVALFELLINFIWIMLNGLTNKWINIQNEGLQEIELFGKGTPVKFYSGEKFHRLQGREVLGFQFVLMFFAMLAILCWIMFTVHLIRNYPLPISLPKLF